MRRIRNDQPSFRFYPGAYRDRRFEQTGETCHVCETRNAWLYQGAVYGLPPASETRFCANCLKTGRIYGYLGEDRDTLIALHQCDFTNEDFDPALADELLYHSPAPASCNPFDWPVLGREPLAYIGIGDDPSFKASEQVRDAIRSEQQKRWPGIATPPDPACFLIFRTLEGKAIRAVLDPG